MEGESLNSGITLDIAVEASLWAPHAFVHQRGWWHDKFITAVGFADIRFGELSIALIDDAQMSRFNSRYRQKSGPTNVLSFPAGGPLLGDIVLSYETIAREAKQKHARFEDHVAHLAIHGFLHLQGFDHRAAAEAKVMEALEITILKALAIDNPYKIGKLK
jgi:probable rRNA maturation factor